MDSAHAPGGHYETDPDKLQHPPNITPGGALPHHRPNRRRQRAASAARGRRQHAAPRPSLQSWLLWHAGCGLTAHIMDPIKTSCTRIHAVPTQIAQTQRPGSTRTLSVINALTGTCEVAENSQTVSWEVPVVSAGPPAVVNNEHAHHAMICGHQSPRHPSGAPPERRRQMIRTLNFAAQRS